MPTDIIAIFEEAQSWSSSDVYQISPAGECASYQTTLTIDSGLIFLGILTKVVFCRNGHRYGLLISCILKLAGLPGGI